MKYKAGDKVKVKENFWEIESDVTVADEMRKLAGRTLEVAFVHSNGNVNTKQDDSNDNTQWAWDKNWLELYNPTITWETLKWKDVVIDGDGSEQMVLVAANDVLTLSELGEFEAVGSVYHKKELQNLGYTIKQPKKKATEQEKKEKDFKREQLSTEKH